MSNLLISKKSKTPNGIVVAAIIFIAVGVFALMTGLTESDRRDSDIMALLKAALPFLCIFGGAAIFVYAKATFGKIYINLYADRVEGIGLCAGKTQSFIFTKAQDYRVLKQNGKICVFCNGVGFDIPLPEIDAAAVYNCYMKGTPTPVDTDKVIVACTHCGTKCRVPKGKGTIVIKCPRCSKDFNANT